MHFEYDFENILNLETEENFLANILFLSAVGGCQEIIRFFIENHYDVVKHYCPTILLCATTYNKLSIVKLIYEFLGPIDSESYVVANLSTALKYNHTDISNYLLSL